MAILRQVAYIASLAPLVVADIGTGGYLVVGNGAPWSLPDSSFRPPSQANATGSFTIPAFNLSSSNASLQDDGHNWNIEISVQANIPLNGSTDTSLSGAEKNEFTQFVSMSFNNVEKTEVSKIAKENKMCGYIMLGLNSNATTDNQDDASKGGNCDFFSQQCQDDLQADAQRQSSDCGSLTIPDSCHDWLGPSGNQIFQMTSFGLNEKLLTDNRFFTFGSAPASENNETEYDAAVRNIWPVLFTFSHTSNTPENITSVTSTLRCLRASNITSGSRDPEASNKGGDGDNGDDGHSNAAGPSSVPTLWLTVYLMAFTSGLAFL
ncbi:uncharacterized protein Triagg1_10624 [Trichoderma aggressivum f. europaeum]|uniref:Uncharacterized protein n=1 Tax=Trichoderma aggressivum f. europaeum TaxID=173218 RepID=A0AAE1I6X6_9HYPO|nr:hypothetical protein Triagg1_10624 [Trichoderma aggressivum f. europaeum]